MTRSQEIKIFENPLFHCPAGDEEKCFALYVELSLTMMMASGGSTCQSVFSSVITVNYHVGELVVSLLVLLYHTAVTALSTCLAVTAILAEDLAATLADLAEFATYFLLLLYRLVI